MSSSIQARPQQASILPRLLVKEKTGKQFPLLNAHFFERPLQTKPLFILFFNVENCFSKQFLPITHETLCPRSVRQPLDKGY